MLTGGPIVLAQDIVQGPSEAFGDAYGEATIREKEFTFSFGPPATETPELSLFRDVIISFTEKSLAGENGTKASLNGNELLFTKTVSNSERTSSFIINRNLLDSDTNTITLTAINGNSWGVTEVTTSYIEAVGIALATLDSTQYGYLEEPSRFTGLRLDFKVATIFENYTLQVTGWDIDSADETQVFLNGLPLGFLSVGPNNDFNDGDLFVLSKNDIRPGANQIEFVQRAPGEGWEGLEFEKWAVSDLTVNQLEVDLIPSSLSIKDEKITENVPFISLATVKNLGTTASGSAVLRYYTSNDSNISRAIDSFIIARSIPAIAAGATASFEKSIQTPLIDRGVYLGVCVAIIGNDSNGNNNCSVGLLLDNKEEENTIIPGVLILLLEEP